MKKKLIIAALVLVSVIGMLVLFANRGNESSQPTENEGPYTVTIKNTEKLRDILLVEQYSLLLEELVNIIRQNIGNETYNASIDNLIIQKNNNIEILLTVPEKNKTIRIVVERPSRSMEKLIVKVPEYSYTKILEPY